MKINDPQKIEMGKRIETAMQNIAIDHVTLATSLNVMSHTIQQWIAGGTSPRGARLFELAKTLQVSSGWLLTGTESNDENLTEISTEIKPAVKKPAKNKASKPALSSANHAQVPLVNYDQLLNWHEIATQPDTLNTLELLDITPDNLKQLCAVRLTDNSMVNPTGFPSLPCGVVVMIDSTRPYQDQDIVAALHTASQTVLIRRYLVGNEQNFLEPLNPDWPAMPADEDYRICGLVSQGFFDLTRLVN